MAYNILGINPSHHGSVCVLSDGEIVYFLEEERLTKSKYDTNPFKVILEVLNKFKIDEVIIAGINTNRGSLGFSDQDPFYAFIKKFHPKLNFTFFDDYHHLSHMYHTYYNSGFKKALGIIIDSGGSGKYTDNKNFEIEVDSIYKCSPNNIINIYKEFISPLHKVPLNVANTYMAVSQYILNFNMHEEGKTMGLSSYGKYNPSIPSLFIKNKSNNNLLYEFSDNTGRRHIYTDNIFDSFRKKKKSLKYTQNQMDLAWKVQRESQQIVGDYVEKYIKETGLKQVCCAGGYFLNCVANYYLKKRFPDVEFYFEPVSHDGGTSIGAAYWKWAQLNPNFHSHKSKSLYYGPQYSKEQLLEGIQKYV